MDIEITVNKIISVDKIVNVKLIINSLKTSLFKNTIWMLLGYAARIGLQGIGFIFLVRILGPAQFGIFSTLLAVAAIISPFIDMGTYSLVVQDIRRGRLVGYAVGDSLLVTLLAIPIGLIVYLIVISLLYNFSITMGLLIALATFTGPKLSNITRSVFVANETLWCSTYLEIIGGALQLMAVFFLYKLDGTIWLWALLYFIQNLTIGIISLCWIFRLFDCPTLGFSNLYSRMKEGIHFSFAGAAGTLTDNLDKAILTSLASPEATGIYSAACRVVNIAVIPMMAFLGALYPRFFSAGIKDGVSGTRKLVFKTLPIFLAYGVLASVGLWVFAHMIAQVFGKGFGEITQAIRFLSIIVVIQVCQYPLGDALTGAGLQPFRTVGQIITLAICVTLNLLLIPFYGWKGAAVAAIASYLSLFIFLITVINLKAGKKI